MAKSRKNFKQTKISDFLSSNRLNESALDEYAAWQSKGQVSKTMPTIENVLRRFGRSEVRMYRELLETAETLGVFYNVDSKSNMNAKCCRARIREMQNAIDHLNGSDDMFSF